MKQLFLASGCLALLSFGLAARPATGDRTPARPYQDRPARPYQDRPARPNHDRPARGDGCGDPLLREMLAELGVTWHHLWRPPA